MKKSNHDKIVQKRKKGEKKIIKYCNIQKISKYKIEGIDLI